MNTEKEYNIAIIGAGQLGSRHLQGIAHADFPVRLEIVDPSAESLRVAEERFLQIPANTRIKSIKFIESIDLLSSNLDLVIIATTANIRLKVIQELLKGRKVSNLLLEKVVFQTEKDFITADKLFKEHNISAWVNCVRRVTPGYHEIKNMLEGSNIISFKYLFGDAFGLGCNAVHILDCMAFLCGCDEYSINENKLSDHIKSSKRAGFIEFSGSLIGSFANSVDFEVSALENSDHPIEFEIISDTMKISVYEIAGKYTVIKNSKNTPQEFPFSIPYQSELTHLTAKDILIKKECYLPTYDASKRIHLPLLNTFLSHLEQVNGKRPETCPIT